jgi:colanic acid/amylovoran biosynthesis glycosyltransferase
VGSDATVVILTASYPYDVAAEKTFVEPEIAHLRAVFDRVVIVPESLKGAREKTPPEVAVEEGYGASLQGRSRFLRATCLAVSSHRFWQEIKDRPKTMIQPRGLVRLTATVGFALMTRNWLARLVKSSGLNPANTLFYTYWLGHLTLGACLLKDTVPGIRVVSRAHGADVYEHRRRPPYFPCRREYLQKLDGLFVVSANGRDHIAGRFPQAAPRCEVARLGVADPGFLAARSEDGAHRIISCAFIEPVKRMDLLIRGLESLGRSRSDASFEWCHIGGGHRLEALKASAASLPENVRCRFKGHVQAGEVLSFYRDNPVDLFVNVSRSEGVAVSIMEAASCGIPIVATAVGGTPEIVSETNGALLSANPTPDEIAEAMWGILSDPELAGRKREGSRRVWQEHYNAGANSSQFAARIRSLLDAS